MMAEHREEPGPTVPFEQHPLYKAAMDDIAAGDETTAVAKLKLLAALYPKDHTVQDLAIRVELKAAVATSAAQAEFSERTVTPHRQPTRGLRAMLMMLLLLVAALVGIAGFIMLYDAMVLPVREAKQTQIALDSLRQTGQLRLEAGDWAGARDAYEALLQAVPGDPTARAAIDYSRQREALDVQYANAIALEQAGDLQGALRALESLQSKDPSYPGLARRIADLQRQVTLEADWQEAQARVQAGDWPAAISALTALRNQDPEFHKAEVEDQLYQAYLQMALPQIDGASGNVEQIRQALEYLDRALALKPAEEQYSEERRLAGRFVDGADAYARQDWEAAVAAWEPVYMARPDYQGGVLRDELRQAYPQAAGQLITRANGSVGLLKQAVHYLAQALSLDPGNSGLADEQRLASEFVDGAEAFAKGDWAAAIAHWGPVYQARPDYQNGVLRSELREACAKSPTPDPAYCKP